MLIAPSYCQPCLQVAFTSPFNVILPLSTISIYSLYVAPVFADTLKVTFKAYPPSAPHHHPSPYLSPLFLAR